MSLRRISRWAVLAALITGCTGSPSTGPATLGPSPTPTAAPTFPAPRAVAAKTIPLPGVKPGGVDLAATDDSIWVGGTNSLFKIDPTSDTVAFEAPTSNEPRRFAIADGAAWIGYFELSLVLRVELATGKETTRIATGVNPDDVISAFGSIWTTDHRGATLTRIDPVANRVVATVEGVGRTGPSGPQGIGAGPDRLWVGVSNSAAVFEVDPATNTVLRSIAVTGAIPCGPILVDALVWVTACAESPHVSRVDQVAGTAVSIKLPGYGGAPVRIGDRIWIPALGDDDPVLIAFSPRDGAVLDVVALPKPAGMDAAVVAFGSLWLADEASGTVVRIPVAELGG